MFTCVFSDVHGNDMILLGVFMSMSKDHLVVAKSLQLSPFLTCYHDQCHVIKWVTSKEMMSLEMV